MVKLQRQVYMASKQMIHYFIHVLIQSLAAIHNKQLLYYNTNARMLLELVFIREGCFTFNNHTCYTQDRPA